MDEPGFWYPGDGKLPWAARLLAPLGALYGRLGPWRFARQPGYAGTAPIICVGNLVAGGTGKTPAAIAIGQRLLADGRKVHFLARGHGGREQGPLAVDITRHSHRDVGDEALLLAAFAPAWVAKNRVAGAEAAARAGADIIVMDDGFQNHPSLRRDCALVVVDGTRGFGNRRIIPAGPLREPIAPALDRAHGIILNGPEDLPVPPEIVASRLPVFRARLRLRAQGLSLNGQRVIAFAGIGNPERFFATVRETGAKLVKAIPFADHAPYSASLIERMARRARDARAQLVTTEKDMARIPLALRYEVRILVVEMVFDDDAALMELIGKRTEKL